MRECSSPSGVPAAIAQAHPDVDYLGIEVHLPGVGALLKRVYEMSLANVRVIRHDAVEVVEAMIPSSSLAAVGGSLHIWLLHREG